MDIVAVLTKVLQEKDREIESLKADVAGLVSLNAEIIRLKQDLAEIRALVSN